jgi:hypothetical protein
MPEDVGYPSNRLKSNIKRRKKKKKNSFARRLTKFLRGTERGRERTRLPER